MHDNQEYQTIIQNSRSCKCFKVRRTRENRNIEQYIGDKEREISGERGKGGGGGVAGGS